MYEQNEGMSDSGQQLIVELKALLDTMEQFYRDWLDARYDGKVPEEDPGWPYREALRVAGFGDPALAGVSEHSWALARTLRFAVDKSEEALCTLQAEIVLSGLELLDELNEMLLERERKLRRLRGEEGSTETP